MQDNNNSKSNEVEKSELEKENTSLRQDIADLNDAHATADKARDEQDAARDLSEASRDEREAEAEVVRLTQVRYRTVFEDSLLGNKIIAPDLRIVQVNQALVNILGYHSKEELIGRHILEFAHPDHVDDWRFLQQKLWTKKLPSFNLETCVIRKDRSSIWINVISILFLDEGKPLGFTIIENIDERHSALDTLRLRERRFHSITNLMPQQVWTADSSGKINFSNEQLSEYLGDGKSLGSDWTNAIHPDDKAHTLQSWRESIDKGNVFNEEFRLKGRDDNYKWYLSRAVPLQDDQQIVLWLGTNTDISLRKLQEQQKDEFMSIASHELKTPLTSIKAYNQLLRNTSSIEQARTFAERSFKQIGRLERLIADLLDVTKITAGKISYQLEDFDFGQMLEEAVNAAHHFSNSHQLVIEKNLSITFHGDKQRLEQVVNNFLTNAIKYSPGADKVIIKAEKQNNNIVVSIKDFGIGISSSHLDKLFDRYYRVDNTAMRFEGLGLGLYIASEILRRHQGSFWIESEQEKGSTFYFRLPLPANIVTASRDERAHYEDEHVKIIFNKAKHRLEVNWTGFQGIESVRSCCEKILEVMKMNRCSKIINDNRELPGSWSEAIEWLADDWFPRMEKEGLRYFAWIYSPSAFNQLSANKSIELKTDKVINKFFSDFESAERWLEDLDGDSSQ